MDALSTHFPVEHFDDSRFALFFLVSYTIVTAQPLLNLNAYAALVVPTVFLVVAMGILLPHFQLFWKSDIHLLLPFKNVLNTLAASIFCAHALCSLIATLAHFAMHALGYVLPSLPQTGLCIFAHMQPFDGFFVGFFPPPLAGTICLTAAGRRASTPERRYTFSSCIVLALSRASGT